MSKIRGSSLYICDACGKQHSRMPGSIYKMKYRDRTKHFCSYKCYNKVVELKERNEFEELDKMFEQYQQGG